MRKLTPDGWDGLTGEQQDAVAIWLGERGVILTDVTLIEERDDGTVDVVRALRNAEGYLYLDRSKVNEMAKETLHFEDAWPL
jgi:hypothetical protein